MLPHAPTRPKYAEYWSASEHLGSANLLDKTYSNGMQAQNPNNLPIEGAYIAFTSLRPDTPPTGYTMPDSGGNYLYIGTYPSNGVWPGMMRVILTPLQAYSIDNKMDDGLPMSGAVRASMQQNLCPGITIPSQTWGTCFNTPYMTSQTALYGATAAASAAVDDSVSPPVYNLNAPLANNVLYNASLHIRVD